MRVGCLSQRAMRIRCTARTPLPLCSYETGTLEGEDDADGEEEDEDDDDDGVESVVAYLPQLLEAKYGKDWESLMGAAPEDDEDEDEDEDEGVEARWDFSNEEEGGIKEEELRWLVMQQMKRDEEDGVVTDIPDDPAATGQLGEESTYQAAEAAAAAEAAEAAEAEAAAEAAEEAEDEDADEAEEAEGVTLPEGISLELSPLLADFVKQREEGLSLPQPFPESEWLQIFTCAVRDESRFEELESTWANLRVLLAYNFDDLECGEIDLQGSLSRAEGGDSMSLEQREYSQGTLTVL